MFDGRDFPGSLDESLFDDWLEQGRKSKIGYNYMLVVWDELDAKYIPLYTEHRDTANGMEKYGEAKGRESLVAIYDLYSEVRIMI